MRRGLLPLLFLSLLLLPIGANLVPSAQSSTGYDWAISAYNSNLSGYSNYTVVFMKYSYFPLNNSGFNYIAEILNIPLNASGVFTIDGSNYNFNETIIQVALADNEGTFYLVVNFVLMGPKGVLLAVAPQEQISYNPSNNFTITVYRSGAEWYAYFITKGQNTSFPDFPIYPGDIITNTQADGYPVTIAFFNVPYTAEPFYGNGYVTYPDVSLEVNAPSQTSFVDANPYFVTLFKLYVNGVPYVSAWSGQNLISASSSSGSDDNGSMIGLYAPPSGVAWGADEYIYTYSYHNGPGYVEYTYWFDVSYWLLGTQNGIKAFAELNGLPINEPQDGYFVNLVTSPQEYIAMPSYTYSSST